MRARTCYDTNISITEMRASGATVELKKVNEISILIEIDPDEANALFEEMKDIEFKPKLKELRDEIRENIFFINMVSKSFRNSLK